MNYTYIRFDEKYLNDFSKKQKTKKTSNAALAPSKDPMDAGCQMASCAGCPPTPQHWQRPATPHTKCGAEQLLPPVNATAQPPGELLRRPNHDQEPGLVLQVLH